MARQIICVHVGNKYPNHYVEILYASCKRNMIQPFRFVVLTDNKEYDITDANFVTRRVEPLLHCKIDRLWWYKMLAFHPDYCDDENLLCDIDVVITGGLDKLWDHKQSEYMICQDFNRQWIRNFKHSNSSVVRFTRKHAESIWQDWNPNKLEWMGKFRGDQDYMDARIADIKWWPRDWIMSWKWEVNKGGMLSPNGSKYAADNTTIPLDCSIIAFHGKPDPHEIEDDAVVRFWHK